MRSFGTRWPAAQVRHLRVAGSRQTAHVITVHLNERTPTCLNFAALLLTVVDDGFSDLLKLGSSKPWPDAIRMLTRGKTSRMDAGPILDYFKPLMEWLREQNAEEAAGWSELSSLPSHL